MRRRHPDVDLLSPIANAAGLIIPLLQLFGGLKIEFDVEDADRNELKTICNTEDIPAEVLSSKLKE
jgi:hypothetical protein